MNEKSIGYIVVEEGDPASVEEILRHDPAKLNKSPAESHIDATKLGYKEYTVFEVFVRKIDQKP